MLSFLMTNESQTCPNCNSLYGYQDAGLWICPECFHEWSLEEKLEESATVNENSFLDSNGVQLQDGDSVSTIKDLKAGKETIKAGTKVKNIKLLDEPVNDHDISCKVPGFGSLYLKCSVVKKVK